MRCRSLRPFFCYWAPPILLGFIIFYLSSRPSPQIGPNIPHIDKLFHFIIYSVLAILIWRGLYYASSPFFKKRAVLFAIIFTVLYGITDEIHQSFLPYRCCDLFDLLSDAFGACIAMIGVTGYKNGHGK